MAKLCSRQEPPYIAGRGTEMDGRLGFTIPLLPLSVRESCELAREAEGLGYTDAWSMESGGTDAFSVAAAVGAVTEKIRVGTAIVPAFTRPPALIAMSTLTAHQACEGRFCLGLGASSETIVERWMGVSYDRPLTRVRETVEVVRAALKGDKVDYEGETVTVKGFRLEQAVAGSVPIHIAALGPRMLALANEIADGVVLFLAAEEGVRIAAKSAPSCESVARIFCFVDESLEQIRDFCRWFLAPYITVPGYNRFLVEQGFEEEASAVAASWAARDRKGALQAITDRLIEAMVICGPVPACKERIESFYDAGLDTPVLAFASASGGSQAIIDGLRNLAPT